MSEEIPTPRTDEMAKAMEMHSEGGQGNAARQLCRQLERELRALTEWRDISTAPNVDGMRILGYSDEWHIALPITWSPYRPSPHWTIDNGAVSSPTHWLPLPPPPKI